MFAQVITNGHPFDFAVLKTRRRSSFAGLFPTDLRFHFGVNFFVEFAKGERTFRSKKKSSPFTRSAAELRRRSTRFRCRERLKSRGERFRKHRFRRPRTDRSVAFRRSVVIRIEIKILHQDRLTERRFVVNA